MSLPLMVLASAGSVTMFFQSYLLAHYSTEALQAHTLACALVALVQGTSVRMASEAQIFVSQACSSKKERQVGVYMWQMVWLSLLSTILMLPFSVILSTLYFNSSPIQQEAAEYFLMLMPGNVLFSLAAALGAFYSGRGRLQPLLFGTVGIIAIHFITAYYTIPLLGLKGAVISQLLSQGCYCLYLFLLIIQKKHRDRFGTNLWQFQWESFLASARIGAFNGLSFAMITLSWVVVLKITAQRGFDYLTVVSFGSTFALLDFFNLGLGQGLSIKAAGLIGANRRHKLVSLVGSALIILMAILLLLFFPLALFPDMLLGFFFPGFPDTFSPDQANALRYTCKLLLYYEFVGVIDRICRGLLTALGDTIYMFFTYMFSLTIGTCFPIYLLVQLGNMSACYFWLLMSSTILFRNVPLVLRLLQHFRSFSKQRLSTSELVS